MCFFCLLWFLFVVSAFAYDIASPWDINMLARRRNHGCATIDDTMFLVGGRFASTIEAMPWSGKGSRQHISASESLLEVNHIVLDVIKSSGNQNRSELWVSCGFGGHELNAELHLDHIVVVDPVTFQVSRGPTLDHPRGACATVVFDGSRDVENKLLDVDIAAKSNFSNVYKSRFVCLFGGLHGPHDEGQSVDTVSCFDRLQNEWTYPLPNMPVGVDHHNVVLVPRGVCDAHAHLFAWGGRHSNYARASTFVSTLRIGDTSWRNLSWSANDAWQLHTASAAAALSTVDRRYVAIIGGLDYRPKLTLLTSVVIRDLCADRVCVSPQRLVRGRGAVSGCRHENENKMVVCGDRKSVV